VKIPVITEFRKLAYKYLNKERSVLENRAWQVYDLQNTTKTIEQWIWNGFEYKMYKMVF